MLSRPIFSEQSSQLVVAAARIVMGACFMFYGISKLFAIAGITGFIASKLPFAPVVFWLAVVLETGLGFLLLIGYASRWAAGYLAFHCVFTAAVFHTNFGNMPQRDHFVANLILAAGFLYVMAVGPGAAALDNGRSGRSFG
jgi:putative oxidoreductase